MPEAAIGRIESVSLTHEGGGNYSGYLKVERDGQSLRLKVNVETDYDPDSSEESPGDYWSWDIQGAEKYRASGKSLQD